MPPKKSASASRAGAGVSKPKQTAARGRASAATKSSRGASAPRRQNQAATSDDEAPEVVSDDGGQEEQNGGSDDDERPEKKTIPPDLLTRLLHEFFEKDGTRITKDANAAVAKYMDIFVREAIARAAAERERGFLEVEDLEKVAPQLLLDL